MKKYVSLLGFGLATLIMSLLVIQSLSLPMTELELIELGKDSTAKIGVELIDPLFGLSLRGSGSGFVVSTPSREYLFITNEHVCVSEESKHTIILHNGDNVLGAHVLRMSKDHDLCVLESTSQIKSGYLRSLIIDYNDRELGIAYIIGHPKGEDLTPSIGSIISFKQVMSPLFDSIVLSNRVYPGNSGSPILNKYGHVMGIVEAADSMSNQGYGIPAFYLKELLEGL